MEQYQYTTADVYERYRGLALNAAYGVSRNWSQAEDACQIAFLKLHQHAGSFPCDVALRAWLVRVARNVILDAKRLSSARSEPLDATSNYTAPTPTIEAELIERQLEFAERQRHEQNRAKFLVAMKLLSEDQRRSVHLHGVKGLSLDAAAAISGKPRVAIRHAYGHGVRRLREIVGTRAARRQTNST